MTARNAHTSQYAHPRTARPRLLLLLLPLGLAAAWPVRAAWPVVDDTGAVLRLAAPATRIVSIAPGATEMLFAAGAGERVLGTAEYSDEPAAAARVPRIGDAHAVDLERILALRPDVVVVWERGNAPAQIAQLGRLGLPLYRVRVERLADVPASIERLGALAGTAPVASAAAARLRARLAAILAAHRGAAPLRVFLQVWNEPIFTVGGSHPMSDGLRYCGASNVFGELSQAGPVISAEAVVERSPEVIVAVATAGDGHAWLDAWRRFPSIEAVRRGALVAFDDRRLARMGPGAIAATEALCARLDGLRAARPARGPAAP